ncbi:unannotated protein [freshwater metagenome]|uniref:Unannotated protein n=1 Tax=freshwater metagenome TaxID=449393 RepID=A0A6J6H1J0_9ZZZZ
MPSSMWRPVGPCCQRSSRSGPRWSGCSSGWNTPYLLIQPPRFVLTLTSGDSVTIRSLTSGTWPRPVSSRPNTSCVLTGFAPVAPPTRSGTGSCGRGAGGTLFTSSPARRHTRPAGESSGKRSHSVVSSTPSSARSASIWVGESSAAWFSGSPAIGNPHPFTVYANTTLGRSVTASQARYESSSRPRS